MVLLIEPDLNPLADGHGSEHFPEGVGAPGWFNLWDTYRRCLTRLGIDVTVPQHLQEMLSAIPHFENVTKRDGSLPIGFWSEGLYLHTIVPPDTDFGLCLQTRLR